MVAARGVAKLGSNAGGLRGGRCCGLFPSLPPAVVVVISLTAGEKSWGRGVRENFSVLLWGVQAVGTARPWAVMPPKPSALSLKNGETV